jgi:hypothetical protein
MDKGFPDGRSVCNRFYVDMIQAREENLMVDVCGSLPKLGGRDTAACHYSLPISSYRYSVAYHCSLDISSYRYSIAYHCPLAISAYRYSKVATRWHAIIHRSNWHFNAMPSFTVPIGMPPRHAIIHRSNLQDATEWSRQHASLVSRETNQSRVFTPIIHFQFLRIDTVQHARPVGAYFSKYRMTLS